MSDELKIDPIHAEIEKKALFEQKKTEVQEKELIVRERRAVSAVAKIEQNDKDAAIAKSTNYGAMSEQEILNKQKENSEYMEAARNKMTFINKKFEKAIPFFRKNLILVGGKSGEGKSTTVANVIRETIGRTNPKTGKKRRVLVLTNEEKSEDVYNRVTCLIKGWHYTNHDQFNDDQVATFGKYIAALAKDGMLTVIDDNYNGAAGTTTTLEGVCQVFDNLIANQEWYDVVIIDYYQNITESRVSPTMADWEVQAALARKLDTYKNVYPAPIVLMAQVLQNDHSNQVPFKVRIEGRKMIFNVCTCAIEMIADRETLTTEWVIHKSRFNEAVGEQITTGYFNGRYVLTEDRSYQQYREIIERTRASVEKAKADKEIKPLPTSKEGEEE